MLVLAVLFAPCDRVSRNHILAAQEAPTQLHEAMTAEAASLVVLRPASSEALLVDPIANRVLARVPTGPEPGDFALSTDGRFAYVTSFGWEPLPRDGAVAPPLAQDGTGTQPAQRGVTVIDLHARRIHSVFQPGNYRQLGAIAAGEGGRLIWVLTEAENGVAELDASTGEVRMLWRTGGRGAADIAVSDDESLIFTANAETGDVTVINRMTVVSSRVATGSRPRGLAVAPTGRELWVVNSGENTISVVGNFRTPRELRRFASGGLEPVRIVFHETRREAWIAHRESRTIAVLAMATGERVAEIVLPDEPSDIVFSRDEMRAYVSSVAGRSLFTIDVASRRLEDAGAVDSLEGEIPDGRPPSTSAEGPFRGSGGA